MGGVSSSPCARSRQVGARPEQVAASRKRAEQRWTELDTAQTEFRESKRLDRLDERSLLLWLTRASIQQDQGSSLEPAESPCVLRGALKWFCADLDPGLGQNPNELVVQSLLVHVPSMRRKCAVRTQKRAGLSGKTGCVGEPASSWYTGCGFGVAGGGGIGLPRSAKDCSQTRKERLLGQSVPLLLRSHKFELSEFALRDPSRRCLPERVIRQGRSCGDKPAEDGVG